MNTHTHINSNPTTHLFTTFHEINRMPDVTTLYNREVILMIEKNNQAGRIAFVNLARH